MRTYLKNLLAVLAVAALVQAAAAQDTIIFATDRDGDTEVYSMDIDGSNQTNRTNNAANDSNPSVSFNGTMITFDTDRDGNLEIYAMDPDGSGQTNLTNNAAADTDPSTGPLASKVLFVSDRDGNSEIYIMNSDGSGQTNISNNAANETEPMFSADGTFLTFTSDRTGSTQIYVMNINGTGVVAVTNSIGNSRQPALSPDGLRCAYSSNRTGSWQLYSTSIVPGGTLPLTSAGGGEPSYSPDGTEIAFSTSRDGNQEVYVMNVNGTSETNLSNSGSADGAPSYGVAPDTVVLPHSFEPFRGLVTGGGLSDLFASDDLKLSVNAHIVLFPGESPLQLIVTGTSPVQTPSELRFKLEASVSTPGLMQTLFMLNYDTGLYEQVDFWTGTPTDSIVEVVITTNPERFVQAGTGEMKSKIAYTQVGITLHFPWAAHLDQTIWTVVN